MPELPEVETVRRGINALAAGRTITHVDVLYPKMIIGDVEEFKRQLAGEKLTTVDRRGKYLLLRFSGNKTVVSHLRMEGKYYVKAEGTPVEKHTHVLFHMDDGQQLRYNDSRKFGRMQLITTGEETTLPGIKKLGMEPFPATFAVDQFISRMKKKKKMVKPALLDQTIVTGLGNIYVDECLWLSKIHPETQCAVLTDDELRVLHDNIITEIDHAIDAGGTTIRSYTDAFQHEGGFQLKLHVYGRQGTPCDRCKTPIEKIKVGQRGTHFCPHCQVKRVD